MKFKYYFFCRLVFVSVAAGLLISCSANNNDDTCSKHHLVHSEHVDDVVKLEMDYSASTRLIVSTSVPVALSNDSNNALLMSSKDVLEVNTEGSCNHDNARVDQKNGRKVYHYLIDCGDGAEIDHIETNILDLLPEVSEIDVSISSPAATKNFVLHRDCSSPIYKYL